MNSNRFTLYPEIPPIHTLEEISLKDSAGNVGSISRLRVDGGWLYMGNSWSTPIFIRDTVPTVSTRKTDPEETDTLDFSLEDEPLIPDRIPCEEDALTREQHSSFMRVLREVMVEDLRHPAIGYKDEHTLQLSWSFTDIPYKSFTLDIFDDGRLEWFFCDNEAMEHAGTEDEPEERLPSLAVEYLKHFKSPPPEGSIESTMRELYAVTSETIDLT